MKARLLVFAVLLAAAPLSAGEMIVLNGDSSTHLTLVFLGDGYAAADMDTYRADVQRFTDALFAQTPWATYKTLFNVYRVDAVSAQSGTDDYCAGTSADTAFDTGFYSTGSDCRLLFSYSSAKIYAAAAEAPGYMPGAGLVIVLVNSSVYGGAASRGAYGVVYRGIDGPEVMAHELGHTLGLLADEYEQAGATYTGAEPDQPNATVTTDKNQVKWARWISPGTPVPTTDQNEDQPGIYQGGMIYQFGVYRPTYNSKMRTLYQPYDRVDEGLLVQRMDALLPPEVSLTSPRSGARLTGLVDVSAAATDGVALSQLALLVDGKPFGAPIPAQSAQSDARWTLDATTLSPGPHTLTVRATDGAGNQTDADEVVTAAAPGTGPSQPPPAAQRVAAAFLSPGLRDGINDTVVFGADVVQVTVADQGGREVYSSTGGSPWDGGGSGSGVYVAHLRRRDGSEAYETITLVR